MLSAVSMDDTSAQGAPRDFVRDALKTDGLKGDASRASVVFFRLLCLQASKLPE